MARTHAIDLLLREHGLTIESRPRDGQPTWRWGEEVVTEDEARESIVAGRARAMRAIKRGEHRE